MKIESHEKQRVYPYDNNGFIDIRPLEAGSCGVEITLYDSFAYWAIVRYKTDPEMMVVFNDKRYFDDWIEQHRDMEVVYQNGRIEPRK